ncbi:MAG TPA: DUF6600 domain-containing protein [Terriglobales bacterium]|jgi:hypothetical protein
MRRQKSWTIYSLVIAFVLTFTAVRPIAAQNDTNPPEQNQAQPQAQPQEQAQPQDQDQDQGPAQYPGNQDQNQGQNQDQDQNVDPSQDPPNRIAQLNYTNGSVSFQPGGQGDWINAVLNRPLTSGDNLWADKNSRAELHVGSTAIRIDSETSLTFLTLNDQTTQLRLSAGALIVRVRHMDDGDTFEVDTPNLAFDIQHTGEYRIDVNPDGNETLITVRQGRGEVTGGGYSYTVVANQQARFSGTDQLDHEIAQLPNSDEFDNWALQRDQQDDRDESANYISTETTGYQDLDEYGHWHYVDGYGPVWTPAGIAVDWAPYRDGHWVWISPWGWTWVEDEPWGFAPFHYGRWAYVQNSWCWVPGPIAVRPVYSPALVAFVGGRGFGVSVGVGGGPGVGWFPLGPGEVYVPWYRTSRVYVNNINVTNTRVNVTQVTNVYNVYNSRTTNVTRINYVNQRVNNGVTVVSRDTFVNARPVNRNIVRVDEKTIVEAPVTRRVDAQPGRPSVIGAGRPVTLHPPAQVMNRPVVGTRVPVMPQRPSFEPQPQQQRVNIENERPGTPRAPNQPQRPGVAQQPPTPRNAPNAPNQPQQPGFQANRNPQPQQNQPQQNQQQQPTQVPRNNPTAPNQPAQPGIRVNNNPEPLQNSPTNGNNGQPTHNIPRPQSTDRQGQENGQGGFRTFTPQQQQQRPQSQPPQQQQNEQRSNVRQAPPPQERNPQQQQNEEQKFHNWQQQRDQHSSPPPANRPESKPQSQPQHSDSRSGHDDHSKDKH